MNQCGACSEDFASVKLFDRHRVGVHAYTLSEGLRLDPPRDDGRRCLAASEMIDNGWERNTEGRWVDPILVEDARTRFGALADAA